MIAAPAPAAYLRPMGRHLFLSVRLWAAAMLAVIGLQAIPVHSLPQQPTSGSAFSASTQEVALAARRAGVAEVRLAPVPVPHPPTEVVRDNESAPLTPEGWPANRQTGPPLRPLPLRGGPTPRGPPALT